MRLFIVSIFMLLCVGCATQYGSTIKNNSDANEIIAIDSLSKLSELYLPAKTTFSLAHPVSEKDIFAQTLITGLRDKGFAVEEFKKGTSFTGVQLKFTLDEIRDEMLFRVSLSVDEKVITRAYRNDAGLITQASSWAFKE
jgi:hypothetical protein